MRMEGLGGRGGTGELAKERGAVSGCLTCIISFMWLGWEREN